MTPRRTVSLLLITWLLGCTTSLPNPVIACDTSADEVPKPKARPKK